MTSTDNAPARPADVEADPRTDGVGDGGARELDPPSEEDIAAGRETDRSLRRETIADPATPFTEDDDE